MKRDEPRTAIAGGEREREDKVSKRILIRITAGCLRITALPVSIRAVFERERARNPQSQVC
jgi:hypothetical protein